MTASATPCTSRRPVRLTLYLPIAEGIVDGSIPRWEEVLALARHAESVGFDGVALGEHFFARFGEHPVGAWDCWSWLAGLAATTERVTLTALVTCTNYRNPALIAKMAETVDAMSGGRFVLGVGAGWLQDEFDAFGFPFDHRVDRFAEAIHIIHGLLRTGRVDFTGQYYQVCELELRPRGPRPSGPPILVGTTGPRMLRLAARYADVWDTNFRPADELPALQATLDAACAEEDRAPATIARSASVTLSLAGESNSFGMPAQLSGTPDEVAASLRAYATAGFSDVVVSLTPCTPEGIDEFLPVLDLLDHEP